MKRHYVTAADIRVADVLLTANAADPSFIYADLVFYTYGDDDHPDVVYVACENNTFRFTSDQEVTVLRGVRL